MSEAVFQSPLFGNIQPQHRRRSIDGVIRAHSASITGITPQFSKQVLTNSNRLSTPVVPVMRRAIPRQTHVPTRAVSLDMVAVQQNTHIQQSDIAQELTVVTDKVHKWKTAVLIALIALTFIGGISIFAITLYTNHKAVAQVAAVTKEANSAITPAADKEPEPEEVPVSGAAMGTYKVAADEPRYIHIPKLKTTARVMQVDILKNGQLGTPRNTNDAAWYKGSSKLSEAGAVLIDGHVSGATTAGVFYGLKNLNNGDAITVEGGDGQIYNYKVVKKEQMPADKVNMSNLLVPVTAGKAGLNLITCGGTYDKASGTFNDRTIIYTERI